MTSTPFFYYFVTHAENNLPLIDCKAAAKSQQNFPKLPTLLDDILFESFPSLKKKLFLKRQILDENFLSTSDEERNEGERKRKKVFGLLKFMSNAIIATLPTTDVAGINWAERRVVFIITC